MAWMSLGFDSPWVHQERLLELFKRSFLFYNRCMTEFSEKREGMSLPVDLTQAFSNASESEFMEQLEAVGQNEARIEIRLDQLVSNIWQMRLKKFLESVGRGGGKRTAIIHASKVEAEAFRSRYPGVE